MTPEELKDKKAVLGEIALRMESYQNLYNELRMQWNKLKIEVGNEMNKELEKKNG